MNAQRIQTFVPELEEIINRRNDYNIITPKCPNGLLNREYLALKQKVINIKNMVHKRTHKCDNCGENHKIFLCPTTSCEICGRKGHSKQICYDKAYYYNRTFLCGCNPAQVKKLRSAEKGKYGEHCCVCKRSAPLYDLSNIENNRVTCGTCYNRKRQATTGETPKAKRVKTPEETPNWSYQNNLVPIEIENPPEWDEPKGSWADKVEQEIYTQKDTSTTVIN